MKNGTLQIGSAVKMQIAELLDNTNLQNKIAYTRLKSSTHFEYSEVSTFFLKRSISSLIIVDLEENVQLFARCMKLYGHSANIFKMGQNFQLLSSRTQWIFQRNSGARLIYPLLENFVETGIFYRWHYLEKLRSRYLGLHLVKKNLTTHSAGFENIFSYLFYNPEITKYPQKLSMKFFSVIVAMYGICCLICVFGLIFEIFSVRQIFRSNTEIYPYIP